MKTKDFCIYFIGIGGAGMSALAEVAFARGYKVLGSDQKDSENIEHLRGLGITCFLGHKKENLSSSLPDLVVKSTAIPDSNPEIQQAHNKGIRIVGRGNFLADLMRLSYGIAIAGTHGKTTTTALCSHVLISGHLDPTCLVGGRVRSLGSHARYGEGRFLVSEADESDRSFLRLAPSIAVVTNIDDDHLEAYESSSELDTAFMYFMNRVPFYGRVIACLDDPRLAALLEHCEGPVWTYGIENERADFNARFITHHPDGSTEFDAFFQNDFLLHASIRLPGVHNIRNALAAIAVGHELELQHEWIEKGLFQFSGVGRRFDIKGSEGGLLVVDDYAHHPTEIRATLEAARALWPEKHLYVCFEPHRYSRTKDLFEDFGPSLELAEKVWLCPVYSAGEDPLEGFEATDLEKKIKERVSCEQVRDYSDLIQRVSQQVSPYLRPSSSNPNTLNPRSIGEAEVLAKAVVLTLGAGTITQVGDQLLNALASQG